MNAKVAKRVRLFFLFLVVGIGLLFLLLPAVVIFENWRGKRAWERFAAESKARGDDLSPEAVIPPEIPDEENFAAIPLFADLFDYDNFRQGLPAGQVRWRNPDAKQRLDDFARIVGKVADKAGVWKAGERVNLIAMAKQIPGANPTDDQDAATAARQLLQFAAQYDAMTAEIRSAASRPKSRFPVHYEDSHNAMYAHLSVLRGFTRLMAITASARLELNDQEAFQDLMLGLRLQESIAPEPALISHLVRVSQLETTLSSIWEGAMRRSWSREQMQELDAALARVDMIHAFRLSIYGERNLFAVPIYSLLQEFPILTAEASGQDTEDAFHGSGYLPRCIFDQGNIIICRKHGELLQAVSPEAHRFYPEKVAAFDAELERWEEDGLLYPYRMFPLLLLPGLSRAPERFARAQVSVDLARISLFLDRHRLKHGRYPESLEGIDPALLGAVRLPTDVVNGESYRYRVLPNGDYLLYGVGWDGQDDGGKVFYTNERKTAVDPRQGDWVWPRPGMPILEYRRAPITEEINE